MNFYSIKTISCFLKKPIEQSGLFKGSMVSNRSVNMAYFFILMSICFSHMRTFEIA